MLCRVELPGLSRPRPVPTAVLLCFHVTSDPQTGAKDNSAICGLLS